MQQLEYREGWSEARLRAFGFMKPLEGRLFPLVLAASAQRKLSKFLPMAKSSLESDMERLGELAKPVGGWSYYTDEDFPSDADDTAFVLQLLAHEPRFRPLLLKSADVIDANEMPNGAIATWLVGKENWDTAESVWGGNESAEVTANALYAIWLVDKFRFSPTIERGIAYLVSMQEKDGSWGPVWYPDPLYGVFVCTRALLRCGQIRGPLKSAAEFVEDKLNAQIRSSRETDNPQTVALAILTLIQLRYQSALIERAVSWLVSAQDSDGGWQSIPLHRFLIPGSKLERRIRATISNRASDDDFVYQSRVASTSLVAGALGSYEIMKRCLNPMGSALWEGI
jgi:Squalene-hopene cyclase C-terminal domain/Prenyltransferase and squalene oxidase repeat